MNTYHETEGENERARKLEKRLLTLILSTSFLAVSFLTIFIIQDKERFIKKVEFYVSEDIRLFDEQKCAGEKIDGEVDPDGNIH